MVFVKNALDKIHHDNVDFPKISQTFGKISEVVGTLVEAILPNIPLGALVRMSTGYSEGILGEVVGFRKEKSLIIPFSEPQGLCAGALVECVELKPTIKISTNLIGKVINSYGYTLDGEKIEGEACPLYREPLNPLLRKRIQKPLDLGVRSLNALLTCGEGQRLGIMAGSGVGKSVLMGMMARFTNVDMNVIALIGERGREVKEFIEDNLGEEGLKRSIVVVATGDQPALIRIRAAQAATTIAEYFRDKGKRVLLMMDSLTRVAMAQREIGLAVGEPPTTRGYTPSVFSLLPRLLERAGNFESLTGSLTGIYTVLVDGDDFNEPICDAARSILDGHIQLSRDMAHRNLFPAVDVLSSVSRVMQDIVHPHQWQMGGVLREWMSLYRRYEDMITIGAYQRGSQPKLDEAINQQEKIQEFLRQPMHQKVTLEESYQSLMELISQGQNHEKIM
jgi:flagellum-specific ATP synthase